MIAIWKRHLSYILTMMEGNFVSVLKKTFKLVSQRVVINIFYFQNSPHNVPRKKAINFYTKHSPHIHTERKYDTFFNNGKVHLVV